MVGERRAVKQLLKECSGVQNITRIRAAYLPRIISQQAFLLDLSTGTPYHAVTPRRRALVILKHATIDAKVLEDRHAHSVSDQTLCRTPHSER